MGGRPLAPDAGQEEGLGPGPGPEPVPGQDRPVTVLLSEPRPLAATGQAGKSTWMESAANRENSRSQHSNPGQCSQIPEPLTPLSHAPTVCPWAGPILLWVSLSASYLEKIPQVPPAQKPCSREEGLPFLRAETGQEPGHQGDHRGFECFLRVRTCQALSAPLT